MLMKTIPLVGAHFRPPAKAILQVAPAGLPLELRPEPENPYDSTAVAVWMAGKSLPAVVGEELGLLAEGYGFSAESIFAESWHLGYLAAKPPKGYEGTLAKEIFGLLAEGKVIGAKLGFLPNGNPAVLVELMP